MKHTTSKHVLIKKDYMKHIIANENEQIKKLHKLVSDSIIEEKLLTESISPTETLNESFGERMSDRIANFGGSWKFIGIFAVVIFTWIAFNSLPQVEHPYDPYPYILFNLVLS